MDDKVLSNNIEDEGIEESLMPEADKGLNLGKLEGTSEIEVANDDKVLMSKDIEDAITKEVISNVNLDRVEQLEEGKTFILDCSHTVVTNYFLSALKHFIISSKRDELSEKLQLENEERKKRGKAELRADAAIYIVGKNGSLTLTGYTDSIMAYNSLRNFISVATADKVKIFVKGDEVGAKIREWKARDISCARLKI